MGKSRMINFVTRMNAARMINFGVREMKRRNFWRAVGAEFVGTMMFLLAVTLVALQWGPVRTSGNNVEIGIGIGLTISTLAFSLGHVSGGHLNPAVTLGMVLIGRTSFMKGLFYVIAQVTGGIVGAFLTAITVPYPQRKSVKLGCNLLAEGVSPGAGFALELLFTFSLVYFVFSVTDQKKPLVDGYLITFGIGLNIATAHVCMIPITGCGINPARSFGPAVVMNEWKDHWVFWFGPLTGALLAAFFYQFVFYAKESSKSEKEKLHEIDFENSHAHEDKEEDEN